MAAKIDGVDENLSDDVSFKRVITQRLETGPLDFMEGGYRTKGILKSSTAHEPLITIVTVVFNGVKFIEDCIQSVVNQSYKNIDFIIFDGGSVDGTLDVIQKYDQQISYWKSEPDRGIYDAMNKAISLAIPGSWVLIIGADDKLIKADYIANAASNFCDARNFLFDVERVDIKTKLKQKHICFIPTKDDDFLSFPLHHQGFLFKKDDELCFDVALGVHADMYFMYTRIHDGGVVKVNETISSYLTGGASSHIYFDNAKSIYSVAKKLQSYCYPEIVHKNLFGFIKLFFKATIRSFLKRLAS